MITHQVLYLSAGLMPSRGMRNGQGVRLPPPPIVERGNPFHWCPRIRDISYREPLGEKTRTRKRETQHLEKNTENKNTTKETSAR